MKKFICIFSLITAVVMAVCVAPNKVRAEENTWYTEAANNAGNPVLLEKDQYFQGISINSHLISDLTFMEIPFSEYISGESNKVQIITFAEALYRKDGEASEEIVMYVYYPDEYNGDNQTIVTTIDFESQKCLVGSGFVDCLNSSDADSKYITTWSKVSSYENITKYSFSKVRVRNSYFSLTKWLLNEYTTGQEVTELKTIFKANITKFKMKKSTTSTIKNDGGNNFYNEQEFQFLFSKDNSLLVEGVRVLSANPQENSNHVNICVTQNTNSVSVTGKAVKYRYLSNLSNKLGFIQVTYEDTYTDINYLFFNVEDLQGKKWGSEVFISEVNLNYILANVTSTHFFEDTDWDKLEEQVKNMDGGTKYSMNFINANGEIVYNTGKNSKFKNTELLATFNSYLKDETLYHNQKVVPDTVTFEYLENSAHNQFVSYFAGFYNTRKATYMTLFNTDSEEFKQYCSLSENNDSDLLSQYQFGLVYGNQNGYPVRQNVKDEGGFWGVSRTILQDYTLISISNIIDIEYKENGKIHRVSVSETNIDNSSIVTPTPPEDDIWEDEPGIPRPKNDATGIWAIIQKIIEFFTITLPKWWADNQTAIIGILITAGIVIVVSFLWRFLSPIITATATKKAVEQASKKKEE